MDTTYSAALLDALAGPGPDAARTYCHVHRVSDGVKLGSAPLASCSITRDGSAAIRNSGQFTLASLDGLTLDQGVTGTNRKFGDDNFGDGIFGDYRRRYLRGALMPLATELRIFTDYLLPGTDTWETVSHGRFIIGDPTFRDGPDGMVVTVQGYDASSIVALAGWEDALVIARNTNGATALSTLLTDRFAGASVTVPTTSETTPRLVYSPGRQMGANPWLDAIDLARDFGWELFVDRDGAFVAQEPPEGTGSPVWTLHAAGTAIRFEQTPSSSGLCNTVVVYGEATGEAPVFATVEDLDGPYGVNTLGRRVTREHRSSRIKTLTQATNAGNRLLRKWGRMTERVMVECFPAPHLEPGDLVFVTSPNLELDDDRYVVTRVLFDADPKIPTRVTVSRRV